ncbi:MAG: ABC transporter permease [Pseudobutyrivibrio sp.]|nr:ABC transporter permease [Pseudobutyrivibrio sp.]
MRSKTSFFNKAIFLKTLSRTWIPTVLYTFILLFMLPIPYLMSRQVSYMDMGKISMHLRARSAMMERLSTTSEAITPMFFAIIIAALAFHYLFSKRDSYMIHAFPVSRKSLFTSNVLAVLIMTILPYLVTSLVTIVASLATGAGCFKEIGYWVISKLVEIIFFDCFAVCTLMISGQVATAVVFYFLFNFIYILCEFVMRMFAEVALFGLSDALGDISENAMTPCAYMTANCHISYDFKWDEADQIIGVETTIGDWKVLVGYLVAALVFLGLAYLMYTKKKLETVADFITVPVLKPVFAVGFSFFVSLTAATIIVEMFNYDDRMSYSIRFAAVIGATILIGIIVFYASQMMIAKTFRVFNMKSGLGCICYTLVCFAILLGLRFDAFGVENRIPKLEDIAWAGISSDYTMVMTETAEIDAVRAVHGAIIADKKEIRDFNQIKDPDLYRDMISIKYKLKDGRTISRSYGVIDENSKYATHEYSEVTDAFFNLVNDPENIKKHVIGDSWDSSSVNKVTFAIMYPNEEEGYYDSVYSDLGGYTEDEQKALYQQVYEAVLKDVDAGTLFTQSFGDTYYSKYANEFSLELYNEKGISDDSTYYWNEDYYTPEKEKYVYTNLSPESVNTLNTLKELGFYTDDGELVTNAECDAMYNRTF